LKPHHFSPAGERIPVPFKLNLADEIPMIVQKMKKDGATDNQIR